MILEAPTAAEVFIKTLKVCEDFDKEKLDTTPSSSEITKDILPFLWGAHHGLIEVVQTSPQVSGLVTKKTKDIQQALIKSQETVTKKYILKT